jgi:hypothetical protein
MEHTNLAMPDAPSTDFVPPTMLFPADRVNKIPEKALTPWQELGPGIQDKYRRKAWWLIEHSHVLKQDAETLAEAIYAGNPSLIAP